MSLSSPPGRGRGLFVLLSALVLLPIAAGSLSRAIAQAGSEGDDSLYKHLSVFTEVLSLIQRSYVDETVVDELFEGAFEGTTDALDPLATYVPAQAVEIYREALAVGTSRSGITVGKESGISFVIGVESGSPGDMAGLEPGDVLAEVDGRSTREIPLWEMQILLAGDKSTIELEILRHGQSVNATLELGKFERREPAMETREEIEILRIFHFGDTTAARVESLIGSLESGKGARLIVDVRGVAGGSAETAFDVAKLFASGLLGELRARNEVASSFENEEKPSWVGRLAILTDAGCQGASEVFVAALKGREGIEVVGTETFGHAGRLASRQTPSGATLFFTDAFLTAPNGEILDSGIEPDIVVRSGRQLLLGEEQDDGDPVLDRALELFGAERETLDAA